MSEIPDNVSQLDRFLQQISSQGIKLQEDEVKEANRKLKDVLLHTMLNEMGCVDETFREVYLQPHYVGSYYENLRVGHPSEFDINLELQLPINESHIEIQTTGTEPGFAKIRVNAQFHSRTSAAVKRNIESWLEDGYLCRDRIIQWLQGTVDKVLCTVNWPQNIIVKRKMSGPAVTLNVRENAKKIEVDFVPVFCFGTNRWPPKPTRQLSGIPCQFGPSLKWCVVPKSPRQTSQIQDSVLKYQWRMSFYMHEKEMMSNQSNMKPVIKFMKLLRDEQNWTNLSSYYIKTMFMLEQVKQDPGTDLWRKSLGHLFTYMLGRLENYLQVQKIPFFWDERCNLISHLNSKEIENICGRVTYLKRQLELALSQPERTISSVMAKLFPLQTKAKEPVYSLPCPGGSNEHSVHEERGLQVAESTDWLTVIGGTAVAVGALILAGRALWRNQNRE